MLSKLSYMNLVIKEVFPTTRKKKKEENTDSRSYFSKSFKRVTLKWFRAEFYPESCRSAWCN